MPQPDPGHTAEIIVQLSSETSAAAVDRVAADIGATLQQLHPATSDAELARRGLTREDVGWFALYGERRPR